ncbi:TfuA-like protein [Amycolatopsis sp. H20-H5]|uniref:TfuA-like protein n=1 Tax=Amycolatopsis sp. H20-H5 TaxID=3046309 RepID=UPI002DC05C25|nr:TfuA-like protein [Amycolatopsis sp. H20-H5]MEC3980178.1 TfuA-like protein [Amycolatopsis sp. H20-H5]
MKLLTYVGTSLRPADLDGLRAHAAEAGVDLSVRPPIVRRDLLSLVDEVGPDTRVLMLDGEFGQQLSVSVTEIREYLRGGRYLAGGSSMGALRAVECRTIGMHAHGWVAASYLDGSVNADDEVALLYDPDSLEPVTVPLVNVRWLAHVLESEGELGHADAAELFALAAGIHYRARTPAALVRASAARLPRHAADLSAEYLAPDRIDSWDRKRLDGLAAVRDEIAASR